MVTPGYHLASQASPFSLISRINTVGEKGLVLERSVIGHVMPGLVGVVDRAYNSVDHANKTGHHMTYDAPFKYQALLPYRVYTGDQGEGTGLRG